MLRNIDSDSITLKAPWMSRKSILYLCGDKLWISLLGLWSVVPFVSIKSISIQTVYLTYSWPKKMEFDYGGPGYVNQLVELSKIWKEPRRMDLGKHVCDITLGCSTWRSNRITKIVLPPVDDMVQSANLLPKRMPIGAKILR